MEWWGGVRRRRMPFKEGYPKKKKNFKELGGEGVYELPSGQQLCIAMTDLI